MKELQLYFVFELVVLDKFHYFCCLTFENHWLAGSLFFETLLIEVINVIKNRCEFV